MPTYLTEPSLLSEVRTLSQRIARLEQNQGDPTVSDTGSALTGSNTPDAGYVSRSGDTMTGNLTLQSGLTATSATFTGNVTIQGTLTTASGGFAQDNLVVHLAGAEAITGIKTFSAEQRFSSGTYIDPDSGVTRAIKVGAGGIAVNGGIKTDSLTASSGITVTGGTITTTGLTASSVIVANGGVQFGGILDLTAVAGTLASTSTGLGDKIGLQSTTYGIGIQSNRFVLFTSSTGAVGFRVSSATGEKSSGSDVHTFFATGNATHTGSLTVGTGMTLSGGTLTAPTGSIDGSTLVKDTVTGVGSSSGTGIGHLAPLTVGADNIAAGAVTSSKLSVAAVASTNLATGTLRDTQTTMFRTATSSTTDSAGQTVGGLTPGTGMTRSADSTAFDGEAIFSGTAVAGAVTTGPGYAGLEPGEYKATFFLWSSAALNNTTLLTLGASGTGVTTASLAVTSNDLASSSKYVGYSIPVTITAATNSLNLTVTQATGGVWRWSHVYVEPRSSLVVNDVQTQYIRDLAVTNAKVNDLSVSKLIAGSITSDDIYMGTGGHLYAGTKNGARVDLNSGGLFGYAPANLWGSAANGVDGTFETQVLQGTDTNITQTLGAAAARSGSTGLIATVTATGVATVLAFDGTGTSGFTVSPSTTYTMSVYIRPQQALSLSQFNVRQYVNSVFVSTITSNTGSFAGGSWVRITHTFTTGSTTNKISPTWELTAANSTAGHVFHFDEAQLELGTAATTFTTVRTNTNTFSLTNTGTLTLAGSITSGSTITGTTLTGTTGLSVGTGNSTFIAGTNGIQLGHATFASAPFRVDLAGNLTATSATIQGSMTAGTISGVNITATNTIDGAAITAGTLSASALSIGSTFGPKNSNSGFETAGANQQTVPNWNANYESSGTITSYGRIADPTSRATGFVYMINPAINGGAAVASDAIPVIPGDTFEVSTQAYATRSDAPIYLRVLFGTTSTFDRSSITGSPSGAIVTNGNGPAYGTGYVDIASAWLLTANTWTLIRGWVKVPAGVSYMRIAPYAWTDATAGYTAYFDDTVMAQRVGGTEIANGTVTTSMINAAGISGTAITTNSLTADRIAAGTLSATSYIQVGSLSTYGMIFDARTGSQGIRLYGGTSPGGVNTVNMDAQTGAVAITGTVTINGASTLSSSLSVSGSITGGGYIQGPEYRTGTSGARVKINSNGIYGYATDGTTENFRYDTSTGLVTLQNASVSGNITANAVAAGATITSPTITGGSFVSSGTTKTQITSGEIYVYGTPTSYPARVVGYARTGGESGVLIQASATGFFGSNNGYLQMDNNTWLAAPTGGSLNLVSGTGGISITGTVGAFDFNGSMRFINAGTNISYLSEGWGIQAHGNATHPLSVPDASIVVGSTPAGSNYGTGNIYLSGTLSTGSVSSTGTISGTTISGSSISCSGDVNAVKLVTYGSVNWIAPYTASSLQVGNLSNSYYISTFPFASGSTSYTVSGSNKSFVIDHPTPSKSDTHWLQHVCLEGPTADVYYRGEGRLESDADPESLLNDASRRVPRVVVSLPDYFEDLTHVEGRTVQVTPIVAPCDIEGCDGFLPYNLAAGEVVDGQFTVYGVGGYMHTCTRFYWEVKAVRKDGPPVVAEPSKDDFVLHGDGPYTYLTPA